MIKDKKILTIVTIFSVIFVLLGGTLAYFSWQTSVEQQTNVVFTIEQDFSCAADGGGNITSTDVMLAPATCTHSEYAIQRTVIVTPIINRDDLNIYMDLWLNVDELDPELANSDNFKYALTTESDSCTDGVITSARSFKDNVVDDKVMLLDDVKYTDLTPQTYYLYIWLDTEETSTDTMNKDFSLSLGGVCSDTPPPYRESILNGADPVLETGMIPVTISDNGAVTTADTSTQWYSYVNRQWANAILVDSSSRGTYINQDGTINGNLPVEEDDILAYYVWIPRYKYTFPKADGKPEEISIVFEKSSIPKSVPASGFASGAEYYTHPAFTFGTSELNGIWVGKFETSHSTLVESASDTNINNLKCKDENCANADGLIIKPDVQSLRYNDVLNMFYASRSITRDENPFGLSLPTDSHMMKNSEWGAVTYLSHSRYGKNAEIGINSNSSNITGAGNGTIYGIPETGIYTYSQSTTGNISGVFDMSGGATEVVMGNHANTPGNSGFSTLPDNKYYDLYPSSQFNGNSSTNMDLCTLETCGGHALHETEGWYSDTFNFVYSIYSWFIRGGAFNGGGTAGAFYSRYYSGRAYDYSFRSVIVK